MDLGVAIGEFAADLLLLGRAPGTVTKHKQELGRLSAWLDGRNWAALTRSQLQGYTRGRAELAPSTRANMLCSLRTFFAWAVEQGYMGLSPAAHFKTPKKPAPLPRALTRDQVRQLASYLQAQEGRRARRDEALMLTALYAGLRARELADLHWPVVDFPGKVINLRLSKMGKGRAVTLHRQLTIVLTSWQQVQGFGPAAPVFSLDGRPISANRAGKIARRVAIATGLPLTTHVLRHTFATWALRRSGNVYAVSKALGHSQLKQTEIYLSAAPGDSAAAVAALPDLDSW